MIVRLYSLGLIIGPWTSSKPWRSRLAALSWIFSSGGSGRPGSVAAFPALTRPAVSRHLRILRESQLVDVRPDGTRRIYSLRPAALAELDRWLDSYRRFWSARLDALERHLDSRMSREHAEDAT